MLKPLLLEMLVTVPLIVCGLRATAVTSGIPCGVFAPCDKLEKFWPRTKLEAPKAGTNGRFCRLLNSPETVKVTPLAAWTALSHTTISGSGKQAFGRIMSCPGWPLVKVQGPTNSAMAEGSFT